MLILNIQVVKICNAKYYGKKVFEKLTKLIKNFYFKQFF